MSHLYKEWHDLVREYVEKAERGDPYTYDRKDLPEGGIVFVTHDWHDRLTEERKRLNKEYALQQSSTGVEQNNGEKQDDK